MARPTKLTPELTERICRKIAVGCSPLSAALSEHVGESTLGTWLRRGADPSSPAKYRAFRAAVEEACGRAVASAEIVARRDNYQYWLSRSPVARKLGWGERSQVEVDATVTGSVNAEAQPNLADFFPVPLLSEALAELEAVGLIAILPRGQPLLRQPGSQPAEIGMEEILDVPVGAPDSDIGIHHHADGPRGDQTGNGDHKET